MEGLAEFFGPCVVDGEAVLGFGGKVDAAHEAFVDADGELVGLV